MPLSNLFPTSHLILFSSISVSHIHALNGPMHYLNVAARALLDLSSASITVYTPSYPAALSLECGSSIRLHLIWSYLSLRIQSFCMSGVSGATWTNADAVTHLNDLRSKYTVRRSVIDGSYLVNAFVDENGDIVENA